MPETTGTGHQDGSMDIRQQQKTFTGFIKLLILGFGLMFLGLIIAALAHG